MPSGVAYAEYFLTSISDDASDADSLGSGAMDESDSDAPGELDDDDDDDIPFPLEGRFHDEKDRREIMALPEVRREQILADRQEEAMRKRQDAQLKQLLKRQGLEAQRLEKRKRKVSATEPDDSPRKSSRARTKQNDAIEGFKRQREQALKDREKSAAERKSYKRRSPSTGRSDDDAEGESEVEWDDGIRKKSRDEPAADLHDYERVRVGRTNFAKVCFYPGFEEAIKGCFARVSVGLDKSTGQNVYRMAQIKGTHSAIRGTVTLLIRACRLLRGQAIPNRSSTRQDILDRSIRCCSPRQVGERVAFRGLFRWQIL